MDNFIILNKILYYIDALKFKNINKKIITELKIVADTIQSLNFRLNRENFSLFEKYFIEKDYIRKILRELVFNGKSEEIESSLKEIPNSLIKLTKIPGIGNKLANILYKELNIVDINDLKQALKEKKLRNIKEIGIKGEEFINKNLNTYNKLQNEFSYSYGISVFNFVKNELEKIGINEIILTGSVRRKKEVIKNLNLLAFNYNIEKILNFLKNSNDFVLIEKNNNFIKFKTIYSELEIIINFIPENYFGSALIYYTGPKSFNLFLNEKARNMNIISTKIGFLKLENLSEKEIFYLFSIPYIPPEFRDNWQIYLKIDNNLSFNYSIKGDLHIHSNYSDGISTIYDLVKEAVEMGYEYIGITDHTEDLKIAKGMKREKILEERLEIKKIEKIFPNIKILFGVEANIRIDGSIDVEEEILKDLDYVIGSIHFNFNESKDINTKRYINAMNNPYITIIAHPSCRKIGERKEMDLDWKSLFIEAEKTKTFLEINSTLDRLDLSSSLLFEANKYNIYFSINSDAHISPQLKFVNEYGVNIAKRALIDEKKIINTYNYKELQKFLNIKRKS
ncbi:MAG: PHP domain-containing protein [Caldisericia bacterium]|nr:PHP domain-containing protein [Caldisericia bacterium]